MRLNKKTKAIQLKDNKRNWNKVFEFLHKGDNNMFSHALSPENILQIKTDRNILIIQPNEWIIKSNGIITKMNNTKYEILFTD